MSENSGDWGERAERAERAENTHCGALRYLSQSAMVEDKSPRAQVQSAIPRFCFYLAPRPKMLLEEIQKKLDERKGTCYITCLYLTLDAG
jgi:hypothetical protein